LLQAGVAQSAARVTAAAGTALSDGDALEQRAALDDVTDLETGDDGNCSLLLDQDALMELCGGTSVRLERKGGKPDGPRVVKLDRGEIRMVVEPRLGEERIEIHTPAAIATLLGTIVHVSVDALGVTAISSAESEILVVPKDASIGGSSKVGAGQQLVVAPGEKVGQPTRMTQKMMESRGGCLIDFHDVALAMDRTASENRKIDEVVNEDIVEDLPGVAAPGGGQTAMVFEPPVESLAEPPKTPDEQGYDPPGPGLEHPGGPQPPDLPPSDLHDGP
jgi:hypothetical protein